MCIDRRQFGDLLIGVESNGSKDEQVARSVILFETECEQTLHVEGIDGQVPRRDY